MVLDLHGAGGQDPAFYIARHLKLSDRPGAVSDTLRYASWTSVDMCPAEELNAKSLVAAALLDLSGIVELANGLCSTGIEYNNTATNHK